MGGLKKLETLSAELKSTQEAVDAVQWERNALLQEIRSRRASSGDHPRTDGSVDEMKLTIDWMDRLLATLKTEQIQAENALQVHLASSREKVKKTPFSSATTERGMQEVSIQPTAHLPGQKLKARWRKLARLGNRGVQILKTEGGGPFLVKGMKRVVHKLDTLLHRLSEPADQMSSQCVFQAAEGSLEAEYENWIKCNEPSTNDLIKQRQTVFSSQLCISLLVSSHNTPLAHLLATIESVRAQTYPHWELCIAEDGSQNTCHKRILEYYSQNDPRIKVRFLSKKREITDIYQETTSLATGEYVALVDLGDTLAPFALFEIIAAINRYPNGDFLYSDEDMITEKGNRRFSPHFKPAWAPDTLRSFNYVNHLSIMERRLFDSVGGFREGFEGTESYDLILRATENAHQIVHVPKVLYHCRKNPRLNFSAVNTEPNSIDAAELALGEHLLRCGLKGRVQRFNQLGIYRVTYRLPRKPLVSIIIPSKDQAEILRRCLASIHDSTYDNYEVVIVENNSSDPNTFDYYAELKGRPEVRVVSWNHPFNYAAAINFGVRQSRGEVLLLLNNDVEVINRDWIESLLEHALREEVGAVGAKLYFPNGTIQHGGVIVGLGDMAGHSGLSMAGRSPGRQWLLHRVQNVSAVTAACLMVRRNVFEQAGGLDERFVIAYNDTDFCLKLLQCGYLNVWTPYAELYHYESLTRGYDNTPEKLARFMFEMRLLAQKWQNFFAEGDPYYSPNFTLEGRNHEWSLRTKEVGTVQPRAVESRRTRNRAA